MKKVTLFFAFLAGIAVMTGCKKDQNVVSFKAVIDQDTKAYFGTQTQPYWDTDDQVCIMGAGYSGKQACELANTTQSYAEIVDVPVLSTSNKYYCAIFPVEAAYKIGIPASDDGTTLATIDFPSQQEYIWDSVNNRQRMNMPMGAVTDTTNKTFIFKNLGSVLRLQVTNSLGKAINVSRVTLYGYGAYLSGLADVTLTPDGNPNITMDGPVRTDVVNVLSLYRFDDEYMKKNLANNASATFDVVVPPFVADSINIELELYDSQDNFIGNSDATINSVNGSRPSLDYNKIVTIAVDVRGYEKPDYAYLAEGPVFNGLIDSLIDNYHEQNSGVTVRRIDFNYYQSTALPPEHLSQEQLNVQYPGYIIVSAEDSPRKIYAHVAVSQGQYGVQIETHADYMYADPNSSGLLRDLTTISNIGWNVDPTTGHGFQTEDVTDMSYMFAGCTSLTSVQGIEMSNFTNVENMSHMFEGCSAYQSLAFHPNTHNLRDTGMVAMFKGCSLLGTLTLSSPFTTGRVTTMRDLFKGCGLNELHLDNFVIPAGIDLTGMFVGAGKFQYYSIYCSEGVYETLNAQDETVIDLTRAQFPNHQSQSK